MNQASLRAPVFGIPRLDAEHDQLLQLVGRMQAAVTDGRPLSELRGLAAVLTLHVRIHFMDEEMFMEGAEYPGLAAHRLRHAEFTEGLLSLQSRLHSTPPRNFEQIVAYELGWIHQHLEAEDDELGRWLREQGILAEHELPDPPWVPSSIPIMRPPELQK